MLDHSVHNLLDKTLKQRFAQGAAANKSRARSALPDEACADQPVAAKLNAEGEDKQGTAGVDQSCVADRQVDSLRGSDKRISLSGVDGRVDDVGASQGLRTRPCLFSRYVPRAVLREVYARDGGQCTFVSADRQRCTARGLLEVHHDLPYALGGAADADNLRLMCRVHNALHAERDFGRDFMLRKLRQVRAERDSVAFQRANAPSMQQAEVLE